MEYGRLLSIKALMSYLSLGQKRASEFGKEAGAVIKYGTRTLYDRNAIDDYITRLGRSQND